MLTCVTACAEPRAPVAASPADVSVPAWAEGSTRPKTSVTLAPAAAAPVSLGSDAKAAAHHGKRVDLDLVDADLPNVCRLIGELAGVNVVVSDGVTGKVTMRLKGVPWDEALEAILRARGYRSERVGSVVMVLAK